MNPRRILIDGKSYASVDEMPKEVRRQYEEAMKGFQESSHEDAPGVASDLKSVFVDNNGNGMPDILEGKHAINIAGGMKFIVGGKLYDSLEELSPEARMKYEQAMGSLNINRNGTPDFLEGMLNLPNPTVQSAFSTPTHPPASNTRQASLIPIAGTPAIAPDTSNGWALALAGLLFLMVCGVGAIGVWYFLLR